MSKKTIVIGASTNPSRYSYKAVTALRNHGHEVIAYGRKKGSIGETPIITELNGIDEVDTITVYISKNNQSDLLKLIKEIMPQRVIFNPGAENFDIIPEITALGIESIEACTLVMLNIGNY
jgi:predicted CoA-binding protein